MPQLSSWQGTVLAEQITAVEKVIDSPDEYMLGLKNGMVIRVYQSYIDRYNVRIGGYYVQSRNSEMLYVSGDVFERVFTKS